VNLGIARICPLQAALAPLHIDPTQALTRPAIFHSECRRGAQYEDEMTLEELRKQIDALDLQMVELLNKRACTVLKIGHLKAAISMPVHEPTREKVVYANVRAANKGPLPDIELTRIFERIIDVMRSLEMHELEAEKNAQAVAPGLATDAEAPETGKKQ
jgi:chorismate mutase